MPKILKAPATSAKSGLSLSTMYRFIGQGKFPKPVKLGEAASGWLEDEIDDWITKRREKRDREQAEKARLSEATGS